MTSENSQPNGRFQNDTSEVYSNYMKQLQQWSNNMRWHTWMWSQYSMVQTFSLHMQMMNSQHQQISPTSSSSTSTAFPVNHVNNQIPTQRTVTAVHMRQYEVPPLARRLLAEVGDFIVLFVIKTFALFLLMYYLNLDFSFNITKDGLLNVKFIKYEETETSGLADYFLNNSSSDDDSPFDFELPFILTITFLYRVLTGVYEWLCVWLFECTPGKLFFGLKVIQCHSVVQTSPNTVLVNPGTPASLYNALMRSLVKNLMIAFLIPAFLSAFFYPHKRTSYDVLSNTIVVTKPLRRRNAA